MILTGNQIKIARENGWLDISDFDEKRLNPNSYNLRLADELVMYGTEYHLKELNRDVFLDLQLDMKKHMPYVIRKIPEEGFVLQPGKLYLGRTMEYTETHKFVPMLEGRSSVGRLGISIHSTAGFGDIGFCGYWTLEISCVQPVRIYPGVEICQIYYHTIAPDSEIWIPNAYQGCLKCVFYETNELEEPCRECLESKKYKHYKPTNPTVMTYDNGKYQKNRDIQPSMLWKELQDDNLSAT